MGMQTRHQQGFTLIEVMLFLGITSALIIGVLASSSLAINQQRYRDAVNSLQTLIQHQYNETSNVVNARNPAGDRKCDAAGIVTKADDPTAVEARGTSECLVMGRYFKLTDGKAIEISSVLGFRNDTTDPDDDLDALSQYSYFVSKADTFDNEVAWGGTAEVKNSVGGVIAPQAAILLLRSPLTGVNRTFVFQQGSLVDEINTAAVIVRDNMREFTICIDPGAFTLSQSIGVIVRANASNASAVELTGDNGC